METIFEAARKSVDNKSRFQRLRHSRKFHSVRSALSGKGSAGAKTAKLLGMGAAYALKEIPVPVLGSILKKAEEHIEKKARRHFHKRHVKEGAPIETVVKFELKELSVEKLDAFRWKLRDAMLQVNRLVASFPAKAVEAERAEKICDPWFEVAKAVAQAERRRDRLTENLDAIKGVIAHTEAWIRDQNREINRFKGMYGGKYADLMKAQTDKAARINDANSAIELLQGVHENCEHYCYVDQLGRGSGWLNERNTLDAAYRRFAVPDMDDMQSRQEPEE